MNAAAAGQPYRPDIDGLRGIAVAVVVLFHAGVGATSGGFVGVDVFFVISGFLISSQILSLVGDGRFSLRDFYERRARRIIPALALVLIASSAAACYILPPAALVHFGRDVAANIVFVPNIDYWRALGGGYFAPAAADLPLLHTWSLGVEEQFYLLFPICFAWIVRRRVSSVPAVIMACILASFALDAAVSEAGHANAAFFPFPTRAWELLLGTAVAVVPSRMPWGGAWRTLASLLGILGILGSVAYFHPYMRHVGIAMAIPTLSTALLIDANSDAASPIAKALSVRPLVFLGLISYSLYLWHWPVLIFARQLTPASSQGRTAALVTSSVVLAVASWWFVELPFRRRVGGVPRGVALWAAAASGSLLIGFVAADQLFNGWPARDSPTVLAYLKADDPSPVVSRCQGTPQTLGGTFCRIGAPGGAANVLVVWGDSHARAITDVLDVVGMEHGVLGSLATHPGCAPLLGVSRDGPDCQSFNDEVMRRIRAQHIRNVVLVARWSEWSVGFEPETRYNDGPRFFLRERGKLPTTVEENRSAFERALSRTVSSLTAVGTRVFLVEDVPNYFRNVPFLLANAARRGADVELLGMPTDTNRSEQSAEREIFQRMADQEHVIVVDAAAPLCPTERCLVAEGGRSLYRDENHLAGLGALKLKPIIGRMFDEFQR